ncbi:unnamed protein product [Cercopithifilaria johnstoni]|uniref:Uncharacterized protein n=1 Tax=Cercopithifilaria johnstoni TaxID=2874296 RepID=A0A8J2Q2E9_9BILA|nr:unnamed protein product [Cercopithifilaria johnstoni]
MESKNIEEKLCALWWTQCNNGGGIGEGRRRRRRKENEEEEEQEEEEEEEEGEEEDEAGEEYLRRGIYEEYKNDGYKGMYVHHAIRPSLKPYFT